jgi:fluoride ion exporter CrcB/FEX
MTLSTFGLETVNSIREGAYIVGVSNFLANKVIDAALVILGMLVGRFW